ncbi:hypothetical protein D3C80_1388040 [compost metagenome]
MAEAGRLDQQAVRARLAQQAAEADLEGRAVDAAQAAAGHLAEGDAVGVGGQQRGVEADLAELVDQDRPALARRLLRQQLADQRGLAGAQRAGDQVGGDVLEHGLPVDKPGGKLCRAVDNCTGVSFSPAYRQSAMLARATAAPGG